MFRGSSLHALAAATATFLASADAADPVSDAFDQFLQEQDRAYTKGSAEHSERFAVFSLRLAAIEGHNSDPHRTWTAGVNHFTDRSDSELASVLGYKPAGRTGDSDPSPQAAVVGELAQRGTAQQLVDWRNLTIASQIPDQGSCGSCWAVTTASVLDAHHEIYIGTAKRFSAQEIVSCVQNPKHCGGKGGCDGATVELGMDYALKSGLSTMTETPYKGDDTPCGSLQMPVLAEASEVGAGGHAFGLVGWRKLPDNQEMPLVRAVVEQGPVAVSVAASHWFSYKAGIFSGCPKDVVVDHAVTLYGIGQDGERKYWLIRNSWGGSWGEKGFIRMVRTESEDTYCGWDNDPAKGTGCDGGPSRARVCGTCGILFDSVVPTFNKTMAGATKKMEKVSDSPNQETMPVLQEVAGASHHAEQRPVQRHGEQPTLMRREA